MLQWMARRDAPTPLEHTTPEDAVDAGFHASANRDGDVYLVRAEGELDVGTAGVLADELDRAAATDAKLIVLDLSDVTFIDSTGIGLLVKTSRRWAAGRLRLIPVEGQVRRVFELTGVAEYLEFVTESPDAARRQAVAS